VIPPSPRCWPTYEWGQGVEFEPCPRKIPPSFDELIDLLRVRLGDADALDNSAIHSFTELMRDQAHLPDQWYWNAIEELETQGHLHPASHRVSGGDASDLP